MKAFRREKIFTLLGAFLLPCVLIFTVFAVMGIYPFGEKSLLIIDMNNEYVDYLAQMNESVRTGGSLLRSWNMGMGLNMLGLIAFYTASPFNLLVVLFPVEWITEVLFAITVLKIGMAGLLFAIYTRYTFQRGGWFAIAFSVAYAMCAYNIAYASNIMWLDGVAFLPLVLLGVERLLREKRIGILLFSYAYIFFSSYYIGYMIGVFTVLYCTAVWFSRKRERTFRQYGQMLARLVGTAILAAGLCAFLLLPAFLGLKEGQSTMWSYGDSLALQKPLVRILSRLLPGMYDTLTDSGYPNVYCTVFGLLYGVVYFCHRGIPRREKLVYGGLLFLLLLSFSSGLLDLAWHAFEDPTWFPARYSFLFSFFLLYLAMRAAGRQHELTAAGMAAALGVLVLLITEVAVGKFRYQSGKSLLAAVLLLFIYALAWRLSRTKKVFWVAPVVVLFICAEAWGNALVMERNLDQEFQYKSRESYTSFREKYEPAVKRVAAQDADVYRLEILRLRNANGGMALGYNGISHYSTTTNQPLNTFLRRLGYNKGTVNELRFARNTPLTNGLLGLRYILSDTELGAGYHRRADVEGVGIYENSVAFPMAFWAGTEALDFIGSTADAPQDPFALQNLLLDSLGLPEAPFSVLPDVEVILNNADREERDGYIRYVPRVLSEPATVEFQLHNPQMREIYAYFPVWNNKFSKAWVESGSLKKEELRYRQNSVLTLGSGETIRLALDLGGSEARIAGEYFYALDIAAAQRAAQTAKERAARFQSFEDTYVRMAVSASEPGALVTTIPANHGWRISVDGERVSSKSFAGVFLAANLPKGEHVVELRYTPPGFLAGCVISALSALAILAYLYRRRKRHQKLSFK